VGNHSPNDAASQSKKRILGMFKTFIMTFPRGKQLKSSLRLDDLRANFRTRSGYQATSRYSV
jgi:hypothetical protein